MVQHSHNRINERIRSYWDEVRGARPLPEERDIDPEGLRDVWDACFLVKPVPPEAGGIGFRYDYLGKDLIDAFGGDVTHQEVYAKLVSTDSPPLVRSFAEVIKTGKPVEEQAEFTNVQGLLIKYRSCMLPLGNGAEGVNYILGGMKWKLF